MSNPTITITSLTEPLDPALWESLMAPPATLEDRLNERIAELEARIESMERDRQVQTVCTTLLQMVVSGDMAYYLSGPGQGMLGSWRKLTQDASEGMRHLAAQEREG